MVLKTGSLQNQIALENQLLAQKKSEAEASIRDFQEKNKTLSIEKELIQNLADEKVSEITELKREVDFLKEDLKRRHFQATLLEWNQEKANYINNRLTEKRKEYAAAAKYCIVPLMRILTVLIINPLLWKHYDDLKLLIIERNLPKWMLFIVFVIIGILSAYELIFRTFFADKDKFKNGLVWLMTFNIENKKIKLINNFYSHFEKEYLQEKAEPQANEALAPANQPLVN